MSSQVDRSVIATEAARAVSQANLTPSGGLSEEDQRRIALARYRNDPSPIVREFLATHEIQGKSREQHYNILALTLSKITGMSYINKNEKEAYSRYFYKAVMDWKRMRGEEYDAIDSAFVDLVRLEFFLRLSGSVEGVERKGQFENNNSIRIEGEQQRKGHFSFLSR